MFNIETFYKMNIKKDGNCLFRAISCFLDKDLNNCRRKKNGEPVLPQLQQKENDISSSLRLLVIHYLMLHKKKFSSSLHYDNELYDSIEERINTIKNEGEFAGNLELYVISKMFRIQINVYVNKDKLFNLISKIGNYNLSCNLFYDSNHYELLTLNNDYKEVFNKEKEKWLEDNPDIKFTDINYSFEYESENDFELI